jgi:endoglycosylceramidase
MEFSSNEAVLGYELINEPWAGDVFTDPELIVPTVADRKNLQPLYDSTAAAIRQADTQHPILFGGVTWGVLPVQWIHTKVVSHGVSDV